MSPFEIFRVPVTLFRKAPGVYVNGLWVEGNESTIDITASIQPTTGEEMLTLPEGRRERKTYSLFTSSRVYTVQDQTNPDQLVIFGDRYEVIKVEVWQNNPPVFGIVNHYKLYAQALEAIA